MKESILLEGVNANFMILSLLAVFWFSFYIVKNWHLGYLFLRPALSLWALFIGESILRTNFWLARHIINGGNHTWQPSNMATVIGSLVGSWAILCIIFIFAPEKHRIKAVMSAFVIASVFLYLTLNQII